MGESRTELLQWVNELLAINYTKIEQCGTGAAYCQVMDSIYGTQAHMTCHSYLGGLTVLVASRDGVFRRRAYAAGQDECQTRIRVHRQFQGYAELLQNS